MVHGNGRVRGWLWTVGVVVSLSQAAVAEPVPAEAQAALRGFVAAHCLDCHDEGTRTGGLSLETLGESDLLAHRKQWEQVLRRLHGREMPPADAARPDEPAYERAVATLESVLDADAAAHPRPGRTESFRRLNRTEYQNAIRDLLAVEIDATALLPADEASHDFDNVTVGQLSPTLLNRYVSAAQKIARLAVGGTGRSPGGDTFRVKPDLTQEGHIAGLPLGTRGGALLRYTFPREGTYEIQIRLMRDRNEEVEGLYAPHELEVLLDRERVTVFTVKPPRGDIGHELVDAHLTARFAATAGPHDLGVTFVKQPTRVLETMRQPYEAHFNMHRHPRQSPAIYQVSITGPHESTGPGEAASRRRIFVCRPSDTAEEEECARQILTRLMERAYRRPVQEADLVSPLELYREARAQSGFEAGIELALSAVLVNPNFLFRIERDPEGAPPAAAQPVSDLELASRLSFFLWSSLPDEELLDLAAHGRLSSPDVLEEQVRRLLADPRSESLVTNFAGQWLYLRNLDAITPDLRLFPDFDDNLRQAFRRETELFVESTLREDRSVLDLLRADYTFLNERLAKHYGIPHVYGSHFRRVQLEPGTVRGGLLRHGSILTVTSYATRTSPVIRGHWILKNLVGSPPPPPPPNVPALSDNSVSAALPIRERLAQHRANPACAVCHDVMDPVGFALENFDAVGRWRALEAGLPIDARGSLPDGRQFTGVDGLEQGLLQRPELFVRTLVEKLLTFALGRGVTWDDGPAIRQIVRDAGEEEYRWSALLVSLTRSTPFLMRTTE
jgi:hypothetical protein